MELPLQAASMAHVASAAALPDAMRKSNEMYTKALGFHRAFVSQVFRGRHVQISRAFELVSSNIMLAFFEAIQHTSYDAYRVHISAAASFLEMIGAEDCKSGVLNQLFFSVRAQTVSSAFDCQVRMLMNIGFSVSHDERTGPFCLSAVGQCSLHRFTFQTDF